MGVSSPARAKRLAERDPVTYVIFDLLWLDGHSLMERPYAERRAALAALSLRGERWQAPDHIVGHGAETLAASERAGLEGVIAKRLDSPYEPRRRSGAWIKLKNVRLERLAVGGWLAGQGRRRERIGALLVGERLEDGTLRYAGRVGSGFGEEELEQLAAALAPLERSESPFAPGGVAKPPRGANFVEPALEVEVAFREWTQDGVLRQPSFKRLLTPAAPADSALEIGAARGGRAAARVDGRELVLSNLDKVLYPATGFTKGQVIDYYATIAPVLLPHLEGRALTVVRYPDGVEGKAFFQKQSPAHRPAWVATATVASGRGEKRESIDYTLVEDRATLVWLANLAALELHTPMARVAEIERPTAVVFDLDPGPPAGLLECCRVALWLQGLFERIGLVSFAKTSGSKGLQVYVPLNSAEVTHEQAKSFARAVALALEQAEPDLAVSRMTKTLRAGKVLIDWSQNDGKKTTVSVYSLRARERPNVSAPLEWAEVRTVLDGADGEALQLDSDAVLARVRERGDLFASVLSLVQVLPSL
jgi:bifunctional non-homologous end joining protein LigD